MLLCTTCWHPSFIHRLAASHPFPPPMRGNFITRLVAPPLLLYGPAHALREGRGLRAAQVRGGGCLPKRFLRAGLRAESAGAAARAMAACKQVTGSRREAFLPPSLRAGALLMAERLRLLRRLCWSSARPRGLHGGRRSTKPTTLGRQTRSIGALEKRIRQMQACMQAGQAAN